MQKYELYCKVLSELLRNTLPLFSIGNLVKLGYAMFFLEFFNYFPISKVCSNSTMK